MAELSYLPPEIVTNIFARLPMETLSNVILVNKFCLHLISSSDFARVHLQHSKKQGQTNCRVIFPTSGKFFKQVSFESLLSLSVNVVDLDISNIGSWKQNLCVVGSCDGLVCIVLEYYTLLLLWNPCTGKYKILPRFSLHLDDYNERHFGISYGFGYDESTNDYKVVALSSSCRRRSTETTYRNLVNIFSLKRESWKTTMLSDFGLCVEGVDMGKLASGKLHWYLYDAKNWRWDIVSFDLGSEVFGRVELPSNDEDDGFEVSFNVLDGFICLLRSYGPEQQQNLLDLLLWKEYGVKESWTKIATVSCVEILNDFELCSMLPNGEILFYSCKCCAVYNPKDDSFRLPSMTRLNFTAEPVLYVQSLVSPVV